MKKALLLTAILTFATISTNQLFGMWGYIQPRSHGNIKSKLWTCEQAQREFKEAIEHVSWLLRKPVTPNSEQSDWLKPLVTNTLRALRQVKDQIDYRCMTLQIEAEQSEV